MKGSKDGNAQKQKQFWSASAEVYFEELYKDVKEYPSLLLRHRYILDLVDSTGGKVLDIGCGPERWFAISSNWASTSTEWISPKGCSRSPRETWGTASEDRDYFFPVRQYRSAAVSGQIF